MDRQFVRTAAIVVCAVWAASCGTIGVLDPTAPKAASAAATPTLATVASAQPATDPVRQASDMRATLTSEVDHAHMLRVSGNFADAGKALGQLMLIAPDDGRVVGEYGKVLAQEGRPQEAVQFLKRGLELSPNDWTLYSALGVAYDQTDDHADARSAYEHALALKPADPDTLNNYAVSRMLSGDLDGAQHLLLQASADGDPDGKIANNLAALASMKHPGSAAPSAARPVAVAANHPSAQPAMHAPRALASSNVVMETIPVDPKAGPVAPSTKRDRKLAKATTPKTHIASTQTSKTSDSANGMPILRTAADGQ